MRTITIAAGSALVLCLGLGAASIAAQPRTTAQRAAPSTSASVATPADLALAPRIGRTGGRPGVRPPRGVPPGAVALSAWDCNTLGGTVVTVFDGRCGSSGQYCRMPNTFAACIDEVARRR